MRERRTSLAHRGRLQIDNSPRPAHIGFSRREEHDTAIASRVGNDPRGISLWGQERSPDAQRQSHAEESSRSFAAAAAYWGMNPFAFQKGRFFAEELDVALLAAHIGTPFYCYSTAALEQNYRAFAACFPRHVLIAYSVKANGNLAVMRTLSRLSAGA